MLCNVKLIGEEWSNPSKLHDALPSVHDCNLILAHQFYATLSSDELNFPHKKAGHYEMRSFSIVPLLLTQHSNNYLKKCVCLFLVNIIKLAVMTLVAFNIKICKSTLKNLFCLLV